MMETPVTDTSKKSSSADDDDITLNEEWIQEQIDRLLAWEIMTRALTLNTEEIPAEKLCDIYNLSFQEIAKITTQNSKDVFGV